MATRLFADEALRVLWLARRRQELALSGEGVWLRTGRHQAELGWDELEQVQLSYVALPGRPLAWVDLFASDAIHRVGVFPKRPAITWVAACGAAVRDAGLGTAFLAGGEGFALLRPPAACP